MKLLRVPKLTRGTGEEQANTVFQLKGPVQQPDNSTFFRN